MGARDIEVERDDPYPLKPSFHRVCRPRSADRRPDGVNPFQQLGRCHRRHCRVLIAGVRDECGQIDVTAIRRDEDTRVD